MTEPQTSGLVRRWEDVAAITLGIVAVAGAFLLHPALDAIVINAAIAGLLIIALAALDLTGSPHWEEPFEMVAGAWLAVSPFWFGYGDPLRTTHAVVGILVAIAIVPSLTSAPLEGLDRYCGLLSLSCQSPASKRLRSGCSGFTSSPRSGSPQPPRMTARA